ncbi:MAG: hypothetical protein RJQ09_06150 [Cyclobacteriaceae bacterium]
MHEIQPFHRWLNYYDPAADDASPFYGKEYNYDLYSDTIYGYYIDPAWDFMGSETLYLKVLYADYDNGYLIIEFIGEWNDAINNDIMHLKRNIIEYYSINGINKFILIGENVLDFHGSDDSYYEDWFDDVEEGWIAAINFREHVIDEWKQFGIDSYFNYGGSLEINNWRTMKPPQFFLRVDSQIQKRLA